jgi:hypothetical protein
MVIPGIESHPIFKNNEDLRKLVGGLAPGVAKALR